MIAMPDRQLLRSSLVLCLLLFTGVSRATPSMAPGLFSDSIPRTEGPAAPKGTYARTADGLIVYPDTSLSGNTAAVKLQVIANKEVSGYTMRPSAVRA